MNERLNESLRDVECYLMDMDGTIYLSLEPIDGATESIKRLKERGKVLYLTNNTSTSRNEYVIKLSKMGFEVAREDIFTAGLATINYIKNMRLKQNAHILGTQKLKEEFVSFGFNVESENPDLVVIGYDTELTYRKLCDACDLIRKGVPFIATHPDFNCPKLGGYNPDVGAFLALIKASTGFDPLVICGKPFSPMAEAIKNLVNLPPEKIAMVGDRLSTDMAFAINNGFKSVLTLSGEATKESLMESGYTVDVVINSIKEL